MAAHIHSFYDKQTGTATHLVFDEEGGTAAIIDPVLDYDAKAGRTNTTNADLLLSFLHEHRLQLRWILETHAHADHLSAAAYLRTQAGGQIAIGAHIGLVQQSFKTIFHLEPEFAIDGSQFDVLFEDQSVFQIGSLSCRALAVPGHTPADMAYQIGDAIFVGDTLFMPDVGTARCDFPGGDAHQLYQSIQKLLSYPPETRLFLCHDYPPTGRPVSMETTVAEQKAHNIHVRDGISETGFVQMRQQRDAQLDMPALLLPSVQVNIRAGTFPPAESDGVHYLKIPLNRF
ncbi:MBL fold metallo-hydrolase [Undibacterium sp. CY7W]|uniref:MBL fold metallo-hydrolase n=1 Tax=Undibacterium rugosum TaxID=2762291 RepID=A0A923I6U3_9BURK|nr:MBL fold metallo-hydrolase [Undibacterium rugosum]MBC3936686.1 MBL fold metallo-hydrolase [Undibacterium rugosum]